MARRRSRFLSEEEKALWQSVKRTVTPLREEPMPPEAPLPLAEAPPSPPPLVKAPKSATAPVPAARPALPTLHPFGRRERHAVVHGKREIDGRLDLHGYRQHEAHARLEGFLAHAQGAGWKLVLVITGKGSGKSDGDFAGLFGDERGVLRRVVPMWLTTPDLRRYVLGFEEAADLHGGAGALYIRIRKRK